LVILSDLKIYGTAILLFFLASGFSQFTNVQLPLPKKACYFFSQVEPSVCINPMDTNEVIAGTVMNDYYYSKDGGRSWTSKSIKSEWGVNGDPCMLIDHHGHYYYFHLSNIDGEVLIGGMVCQRSDVIEGKFNIDSHTEVNGKFHDKEWVCLHPKTGDLYMTWTQFDAYDSADSTDHSYILFSKSLNNGESWTKPVQISFVPGDCVDNDKTSEGAMPAVGPNGEIYVVWSRNDTLWFNTSADDGKTWKKKEVPIAMQPGGWVIDIPGIFRCNGLPVTVCDVSDSENRGTIYVNWIDTANGSDNTDVWLMSSKDGGTSWTAPVKVNSDDQKRHQFLTWMTVDRSNGNLYFVFYDRRNHRGIETDVYVAKSDDGGKTFSNYKVSESSFIPSEDIFFGDYSAISAVNGAIRPMWTRLDYGRISLHTAIVHDKQLK